MNLFDMEIPPYIASLGEVGINGYEYLLTRLDAKQTGNIVEIISCSVDIGTHSNPILSGVFKCENGMYKVKCVHRRGILTKHHYAVYIKKV